MGLGPVASCGLITVIVTQAERADLLLCLLYTSLNPAKLYKLPCGRLEEGAPADLVIFDPDQQWTVEGFESKAFNSPFLGWELTGKVRYTICGGRVVYEDRADGKTEV